MIHLILLLSLSLSWAQELKVYRIGTMSVVFHKVDGMWVNKSCGNTKCLALARGKKAKGSKIQSELLVGGKNPFAVKCKTVMKGSVVIALDKNGNEQSLCHFSDASFLYTI